MKDRPTDWTSLYSDISRDILIFSEIKVLYHMVINQAQL